MVISTEDLIFACESIIDDYLNKDTGHYISVSSCKICKLFLKKKEKDTPFEACKRCIFYNEIEENCYSNYTFPSQVRKNKPSARMLNPKCYYSPLRAEVYKRIKNLLENKGKVSFNTDSKLWASLRKEVYSITYDLYLEFQYDEKYSPEE